MFIWTARLRRAPLLALLTAAAVCGGAFFAAARRSPADPAAAALDAGGIHTNEDRIAYLASYGWQVSPEPVAVEELRVPEAFDETYAQYVELQAEQGFDLAALRGKRIRRYTYAVTNYPTGETDVQADLLLYRDTVVGGDILAADLGGFLHGLAMPGTSS